MLLGSVGVGGLLAVLTGWVAAVVIVPAAALGLPYLLSAPPAAERIRRVEAMEEWTRSLAGVLGAGIGIEQALTATLRSTPEAIKPEVTTLVARLRARWDTETALRAFADDLDDVTGDLVAANLILAARRRNRSLASVLQGVAESVAEDVASRRRIEAGRAKPRGSARLVTLFSLGVMLILAFTGDYVAPYGTPVGQVVLARPAAGVRRRAAVDAQDGRGQAAAADPGSGGPGGCAMTGLQISLALGALIGLAAAVLLYLLVPAQPDLGDVLSRLSPPARRRLGAVVPSAAPDTEERLGIWAERTLPARVLGVPPARDLAVLRMTPARFYGRKVLYGILGLVLPTLLVGFFALIGIKVPLVVPAGVTVILAAVMFMMPSRDIAAAAAKARADCARALSAYIELCALERNSGAGASVALANAAQVGDAWVFGGSARSWPAPATTANPRGTPSRPSPRTSACPSSPTSPTSCAWPTTRAPRCTGSCGPAAPPCAAPSPAPSWPTPTSIEERMYLPASLLGVVFLALLMAPALLRLFGTS